MKTKKGPNAPANYHKKHKSKRDNFDGDPDTVSEYDWHKEIPLDYKVRPIRKEGPGISASHAKKKSADNFA